MIFVGVGKHQTNKIAALLNQKADIRQNQIDAGQMLLGGEGNTAIDNQPLAPSPVADAIDREIHPDLADAAERRKHKFIVGHQP